MLPIKESDIAANGIHLHVTELGQGPAILFVHGFPDTSYTWRRQMQAVAAAGYHAIAPDMRGYGGSSAPADAALYTPLQTAGDLVGLLDAMRAAGHADDFYMFEQIRPEADRIWADAAVTIPGMLYWASGAAPAAEAWDPFVPARSLHRGPPAALPTWIEPDYLAHNIAEFQRTGFHGALNYYRAVQPYFDLSGAYRGAKITQPSYFMWGRSDGLFPIYHLTEAKLRDSLPGLAGYVGLDGVGHWVQHEAADQVSQQLVAFAHAVSPT